jgi:tRNA modification GTPase
MTQAGQSLFRDSIFALSSGSLPAGVAVVRLSGVHVCDALVSMAGGVPVARKASLRPIISPAGDMLDQGLVLFFPAPRSFTGEDCAELHLHGGKAVVAAVMDALAGIDGFRQAEAGEFTRRAFLNGKLDLTSAEAMADLVAAETDAQRRLALENAGGRQARLYGEWRRRLLHARAMIEAELDFADEGDVPGSVSEAVWNDVALLADELESHLAGSKAARIVRDGYRVVVAGAPNAGKSSLVNMLARREVAIVTEIAGTTRDVIETILDLDGYKVILADTAGIRESGDRIEMIGIERAKLAVLDADLVLYLVARDTSERLDSTDLPDSALIRLVETKTDIADDAVVPDAVHRISTVTGAGIDRLVQDIARCASNAGALGNALPARMRHVRLLEVGLGHVRRAIALTEAGDELRAEELRLAEASLGRIIGSTDVEEVLGVIFSQFCIGK